MKIVFFGTPEFALPALRTLLDSEHELLAVVTQPDRQSGRGRKVTPCPVKTSALDAGVNVLQPHKVKDQGFINVLKEIAPSVIVVVAYGQILPKTIIDLPRFGCINIHASLLPLYRGAAPINWSVINGDPKTGITIMLMDEGMDTGPVLLQKAVDILPDDTAGSLSRRLSETGGPLLMDALRGLESGSITPSPQSGEPSYASILKKGDGFIRWTRPAVELDCFIRGMNPWPGAYGFLEGERYKILRAVPVEGGGEPGVIHHITKDSLYVGTGRGLLSLVEVQPSGKPPMRVRAFLQGKRLNEGMKFTLTDD